MPQSGGTNLVLNPSFEASLAGWDSGNSNLGCWLNSGATLSRENIAAAGSFSLKVASPGQYYGASYTLSGTAGHTYTIAAYVKSDGNSIVQLALTSDNSCSGGYVSTAANGWTLIQASYTMPVTGNMYVVARNLNPGPLNFHVDGVQVQDYGSGSNLVTNPSFEANLAGWDSGNSNLGCWLNSGASLSRENIAAAGSFSLKVASPGQYYGASYTLSGTVGHTYTISAYVKSDGNSIVQLALTSDNSCSGGYVSTTANGWTLIQASYTMPVTGNMYVVVRNVNPGPLNFYLDGVQVQDHTNDNSSPPPDFPMARLDPRNRTGTGGEDLLSNNFNRNLPLVGLKGRGVDLGLTLSYNSLVWTRSGNYISFDLDQGSIAPGFRLGFPTVEGPYWNHQANANFYILMTPSGGRMELRQIGNSIYYEAVDSSHLQLIDKTSIDGTLVLAPTDGSKLRFNAVGGGWRCTLIIDRNGNYLSATYKSWGELETVTDTLARVLTFNYDANANIQSITQTWNGQTHQWATFGWGAPHTIQTGFSGVTMIGTANGEAVPVLRQVGLHDGSYFTLSYNGPGQVSAIRRYTSDNVERLRTSYDYDNVTNDCPRLTQTRVWAEYWTGLNGVPTEVATQFGHDADGGCRLTLPDGTVYKEFYAGSAGVPPAPAWQNGLSVETRSYATVADANSNAWQKKTTTTWTQDNTGVGYKTNPRPIETNVNDSSNNRRRTTVDYQTFTLPVSGASCSLPSDVYEWNAGGSAVLRREHTDYNFGTNYLNGRIIGLPDAKLLYDGGNNLMSKTTFVYDLGGEFMQGLPTAAVQHDANYSTAFVVGRGNLVKAQRWDVDFPNDSSKVTEDKVGYDITGNVRFTRDALNHQTTIGYSDSFSADGVTLDAPRPFSTFAYPTSVTNADGFLSTARYRYDFGAKTRVQTPLPNVTTNQPGPITTFAYDNAGRLQQVTSLTNDAYTRYVYNADYVESFSTVNNVADEAYAFKLLNGRGQVFIAGSIHPGSTGGYKAQTTYYDVMGRVMKQSNPTEINNIWAPIGDDEAGWVFTRQTYDWQSRPLQTIHETDGTYKEASYDGCGCAGGEVVTLTDEVGRRQKVYSDVLGRQWKNEVLNWDGSVYSATTNAFNARDQVKLVRQWAGAENGGGAHQDTTMTFDGYGRLQSKHVPQQHAGTATTWEYNNDDTLRKVTDARGASATYIYNNNRHLVNGINYFAPSGVATTPNVTFEYDQVGNRTLMTDGLGTQSYGYNSLSQMTSETRGFADPVSPYLNASYTLSYDYNLAGELKKITDPTNSTIQYGFDSIGRLNTIAGADNLYGNVATYASGFSYRASGGIKGLTYGNNYTLSANYDERMRPIHFKVTAPGGQADVIKNDYSYYADSSPKYLKNWLDEGFDRAYGYDHLTRLKEAYSGSEARDFVNNSSTSGATGPYWQIYQNDAFGNMTQRDNRFWSQSDVYTASYLNHRRTEAGYQYDADGNLLADPDVAYGYDVAGNNTSLAQTSGGLTYATTFDGDGQMVKKVQTSWGTTISVTYYLRSSVLGGQVITEIGGMGQTLGQKQKGYVLAGGEVLAHQQGGLVAWQHQEPLSGSRVDSYSNGAINVLNQLDPMGVDVGFEDPFVNCCIQPPSEPEPGIANLLAGYGIPDGRCTLDGMAIDCGWAMQLMDRGAAVQCPNNDCGPRAVYVDIRYTSGRRESHGGLTNPFAAYADGRSGFMFGGTLLPEGFRATFTGMATGEAARAFFSGMANGNFATATLAAVRAGQDFQNRDRSHHVSYFAQPQNTEKSLYQTCREQTFGSGVNFMGKDIPDEAMSWLFVAAGGTVDDSAFAAALVAKESNFTWRPDQDHGPAQLTHWWKNNYPGLILPHSYDPFPRPDRGPNKKNRDRLFTGSPTNNILTLGNIVRFQRKHHAGNEYMMAKTYYSGAGDQDAYAKEVLGYYRAYKQFFKCLGAK